MGEDDVVYINLPSSASHNWSINWDTIDWRDGQAVSGVDTGVIRFNDTLVTFVLEQQGVVEPTRF